MSKYSNRQLEIVNASALLLTQFGVNGLTVKKIAENVGFSEAAIYRHFKGKDDILYALINYLKERMESRYLSIDVFLEPDDYLMMLFKTQISFFKENQDYVVLGFSEGLFSDNNILNLKLIEVIDLQQQYLLPIFESGQKTDRFIKGVSSESLSDMMIGAFRLKMLKWKMSGFKFDIKKEGEKIIKDLIIIIKNK